MCTPPAQTAVSSLQSAAPQAAAGVVLSSTVGGAEGTGGLPGSGVHVPNVFAPVSDQLAWLGTEAGMAFLARQPQLMQMYFDETLHMVMHRPDWPQAALRFRDYKVAENRDIWSGHSVTANALLDLQESKTQLFNTPDEHVFFQKNGYSVLRAAVPADVVRRAQRIVAASAGATGRMDTRNLCTGGGLTVVAKGSLLSDVDIMALYYESHIHATVQLLINGTHSPQRYSCLILFRVVCNGLILSVFCQ